VPVPSPIEEEAMTVVEFADLPLTGRKRRWDADAAERRVRRWADAESAPNERYRKAFLWYDARRKDEFTAYKLPIADVTDGRLKAVPRGIMAAAGVIQGARGGVDLPGKDVAGIKRVLERYYAKFGEDAPWSQDEGERHGASRRTA
jgi:hypothetical protein